MAMQEEMGADSRLAVKFYKKPVKSEFASQEAGRPIYTDVTYIKIIVPGDGLSEIDRPMYEEDKQRFPKHWYQFMNTHGNDEIITGTPLSQWPLITMSQAEELKGLKFHTVEMIAHASDQQLQRIGMIGGMSPHSFRDKAKSFLNLAEDSAEQAKREEELTALREENAKIKAEADAKFAKMQEQMEALMSMVAEKKKPGRKPKEEVTE